MPKIIKTAPNIGFMGIFLSEICLRSFLVFSKYFFFSEKILRKFQENLAEKKEIFRKNQKRSQANFGQKNTHKPYIWGCFDDFRHFSDNILNAKLIYFI